MEIIPKEQVLKEKKDKKEPLCPECKVEMEFDCNTDVKITKRKWWQGVLYTPSGNAWFSCPLCKKEFLVKDYARRLR